MAAALCTPDDVWANATSAGIRPIDANFSDREVPVEHMSEGQHTVTRASYPYGVIVIPTGSDPEGKPVVLPAIVSGGASVDFELDVDNLMDFGSGVTIVFT